MKATDKSTAPGRNLGLAAAAVLTAVVGLAAVHLYMAAVIRRHTAAFDAYPFPEKLIGLALQRQVFADPGLLPVYGSSELTQPQANRADGFFVARPTGFGAFLIGNPGETCLIIATKLAALGDETRNKRAVVFLSPGWFLEPELDHKGFGVNFSPLHGNVLTFENALSAPLRRDLARRLLDYPETVGQGIPLNAVLHKSARPGTGYGWLSAVLWPVGRAQALVQREIEFVRLWQWWHGAHPNRQTDERKLAAASWADRARQAGEEYARQPLLTTYSVGPPTPYDAVREQLFKDPAHPDADADDNFARACGASKEWVDLDLLLRVAEERAIHLLVVCQPLNANFAQRQGLSARSQTFFYEHLRRACAPYRAQLATFPQVEGDPQFYQDSAHPSGKGWLVYDEVLDAFYHAAPLANQTATH